MKKVSIVAEGGSMRGAYAYGVIKALHDYYGLKRVDVATGSSASIGTLSYYVAGQFKQGSRIWEEELKCQRFLGLQNLARKRPVLDIDYAVDVIIKQKVPLDLDKIRKSMTKFIVPLTNVKTGKVKYYDNRSFFKHHKKELFFEVLRAAMAVPFAYGKTVNIDGIKYFDGSYSDPLPINHPYVKNTQRIIILTDPLNYDFNYFRYEDMLDYAFKKKIPQGVYKSVLNKLKVFKQRFDEVVDLIGGDDIIIFPRKELPLLENSKRQLNKSIKQGYEDAKRHGLLKLFIQDLKKSKRAGYYFDD
ncbi:patatin-like phospholipase family protein [Candidatus Woesearchaeota archaeon]|nr:patatin-like phospholipase family protein [Candidatus Woesearchaeota archaeon]